MSKFDPAKYLMKLKGKDYLEVKWRMVWLTEEVERYTIDTEPITINERLAVFKATVTTFDADGQIIRRATGTKSETPQGFADFIEKAETGSIGRALAALGFGTQFAPEFEGELDANRPVDSPVPNSGHRMADTVARVNAATPQHEHNANPNAPTPKQKGMLWACAKTIWKEDGSARAALQTLADFLFDGAPLEKLTKQQTSVLIDKLNVQDEALRQAARDEVTALQDAMAAQEVTA